jgi:aminocarboxymuconate-semialdehyde decarboxylase
MRFLLDSVGPDRVVLGTDYPAPMILDDAVRWIRGLESLTETEKENILSVNPGRLLGL